MGCFVWDCDEAKKDYVGYNRRSALPMVKGAFEQALKNKTEFMLLNKYTKPVLKRFEVSKNRYLYKGHYFEGGYDRNDFYLERL